MAKKKNTASKRPSRPNVSRRAPRPAAASDAAPCVVGLGASAGGFDALVRFLSVMPADSGLAFIILQHLSPSPRSLSAELFSRHTAMSVAVAKEGARLQANHVYTAPAESDIRVRGGRIRLSKPTEIRGRRLPLDQLFRSLAEDQGERAVGIILSGTGTDGTLGLREIVAHGGVVLVQEPGSAQYDGMPRSAMATGLVTHVLPIAKMPRVLLSYARHPYVRKRTTIPSTDAARNPISKILRLLQAQHGQNFDGYKHGMLIRRIERRLGLLGIERLGEYVKRLQRDVGEVAALRKDLLIGVTEFFRDREAWKTLDSRVLRPLIAAKKTGDPIRAWVAGAGTGEEAYTLAMLVAARLRRLRKLCPVQIFGTDTNQDSLNYARAGRYPTGIAGQVGAEYLKRYFQELKGDHHYQVAPALRESVIFGDHDLLADPPFSRLDLITCRNLLIYLEPDIQRRLLLLFHFALRPGGYLFMGSAETVGVHEKLYRSVDRKWRIYQRVGTTPRDQLDWRLGRTHARALPSKDEQPLSEAGHAAQAAHLARSALLDRFAPPAVLLNDRMEVLYASGATERFLLHKPSAAGGGRPRLSRRIESRLPAALRRAQASQSPVSISAPQGPKSGGVRLQVEFLAARTDAAHTQAEGAHYLVTFQDSGAGRDSTKRRGANSQLQAELRETQEDLQRTIGELKASNEELRASHEETMSGNEELQSMNEELESSKEELQSVNEELNTVNTQLQHKVSELEVANNDLHNLLASNEVATVCLDRSLRIKWFTPATHRLFNLLPSDIGRPISDLSPTAVDATLLQDARAVLQTESARSKELVHRGIHLRRIVPYRAEGDRILGVVITFADISEAKRAAEEEIKAKAAANKKLEQRVRERTEELARLSRELALAEVRERQTIARDLHDGLGQQLNAASIKLDTLRSGDGKNPSRASLDEIATLLDGITGEMRSLTAQLNPPVLEQLGLVPAIEWLGEQMRKMYRLDIDFTDDRLPKPLESVTASIVFRAVRELLINVARHSGVKHAQIAARCTDGHLTLEVSDQGAGFSSSGTAAKSSLGLGLAATRERIAHIGGTITIESEPGRGTTATIQVPMSHP